MIVKKIVRDAGQGPSPTRRAGQTRRLVDYLHSPEKDSPEKAYMVAYMLEAKLGQTVGERLIHAGASGLVSETRAGQRAEMIAIARAAERSENPVDHWLLSWREGEIPSAEQLDQVTAMFLDHLGMADQPCIYACHGDTHNRHLHLAINRHDGAAGRMKAIHNYWDINAAHEAVALIVDRFVWQAEKNARYTVVDGRPVLTSEARGKQAMGAKPITIGAAAAEVRTGYRSAQRIALDEAVPIILAASSWADLHRQLAAVGITYDKVGTNGAVLTIGEDRVAASTVHRSITRERVARRLGAFEPRAADVVVASRDPDVDRFPHAFRADEYRAEREAMQRWRKEGETRRKRARAREKALTVVERARAEALARGTRPPREKPPAPAPNLESFLYGKNESEMATRWRHRQSAPPLPSIAGQRWTSVREPGEVDGFKPFPCSDGIRYARDERSATAFIDRGPRVEVIARDDDAALLAALRLAVVKFDGRISLRGSPEFREQAFTLAQRHGLGAFLVDKDLVERRRALERPIASAATRTNESEPVPRTPVRQPSSVRQESGDMTDVAPTPMRMRLAATARSASLPTSAPPSKSSRPRSSLPVKGPGGSHRPARVAQHHSRPGDADKADNDVLDGTTRDDDDLPTLPPGGGMGR